MPLVKPQAMKSLHTISLQPDKLSAKMHMIILMDIAGRTGGEIAEAADLTESRVSIIRNTPLYVEERDRQLQKLREQVVDKESTNIVEGDPAEKRLKSLKLRAVELYERALDQQLDGDKISLLGKSVADSILDRTGLRAGKEKTSVSVEVTEKMADRFSRVLGEDYGRKLIPMESGDADESSKRQTDGDAPRTVIRVTKEMST